MMENLTRRRFMRETAQGAVGLAAMAAAAPSVLSVPSPNELLGVGCIGLGTRGGNLLSGPIGAATGIKVVAVSDVYKPHLEKGVQRSKNPDVKRYHEYEALLADPAVDAIVVATPDHWHCPILLDAAAAKKDAYIEKGWTRTVAEAKVMREAVEKSGIIMQLGHQGRDRPAGIQARELIDQGLLGPIHLVRTGRYESAPSGQAVYRWYGMYDIYTRPDPAQVIRDLDWKRWLGPLSDRPFSMEHFWHWRCYWDYGTGVAGDLLSHEIDFVQSVLGYGIPDSCMCAGHNNLLKDGREVPDTWNAVYNFEKQACTVTFDCSLNSRALVQPPEFRGTEALLRFDTIAQSVSTFDVIPELGSARFRPRIDAEGLRPGAPIMRFNPDETPTPPSHMQEFFNCVRERKQPKCNAKEAFIETVTFVMSVESYMKRREVRWDPVREEIV